MKVPLVDLQIVNRRIKENFLFRAAKIIDESSFIDGVIVKEFEEKFAEFCGAKHCVAVNSGTSALHLAIKCCANKNDSIVTAPNSFFATAEAISYVSDNVFFEDVGDDANLIIPEEKFYDIIVPVSLYGNPCNLEKLNNKSKILIHDACQAHGAEYRGKKIAALAKATCFSFYPTKNLGALGEGGAIVTDDESLAKEIRLLKAHGQSRRYVHEAVGYNYRMDELQALALLLKIPFLQQDIFERKSIYNRYSKNFKHSNIKLLKIAENVSSVHHLMPVFVNNVGKYTEKLDIAGVQYGYHYPLLITEQEFFRNRWGGKFPNAEKLRRKQLSLPMFVGLSNEQIDYVSETLLKNE